MTNPLDKPAYNSLLSYHNAKSQGDELAIAMQPDFGPFAGMAEYTPEAFAALSKLEIGSDGFWLLDTNPIEPLGNFKISKQVYVDQMVMDRLVEIDSNFEIIPLNQSHAEQIFELATLCKPGPFARRTNELGDFIGIFDDNRLVAMMGERMRIIEQAEMTALSTHPDYRGRGYGAKLFSMVTKRIAERGQLPFLHVYSENEKGLELYEKLGYKFRSKICVTILEKI